MGPDKNLGLGIAQYQLKLNPVARHCHSSGEVILNEEASWPTIFCTKATVLSECERPGTSVAAIAMADHSFTLKDATTPAHKASSS
jgi:hypothetical protein